MALNVTHYILSFGNQEVVSVTNIHPKDEKYFKENNLKVSMEMLRTGDIVLYSETGVLVEDEPLEEMYISKEGESCFEAFWNLRKQVERVRESLL